MCCRRADTAPLHCGNDSLVGLFLTGSVHIIHDVFRTCKPFQSEACEQFYSYWSFWCFSIFIYFLNMLLSEVWNFLNWLNWMVIPKPFAELKYNISKLFPLCPEKWSGLDLLQTCGNGVGISSPAWDGDTHLLRRSLLNILKILMSSWCSSQRHFVLLWERGCWAAVLRFLCTQLCPSSARGSRWCSTVWQGPVPEGWSRVTELTEVLVHKMGWNY